MEVKNIIFSGDSFTWGEGLELENESIRKVIERDCKQKNTRYVYPNYEELLESGYPQYIRNKLKFPTQVAEHFGVVNINPKRNGGDNINAIQFVIGVMGDWKFMDFSHAILNLTHEYRSTLSTKIQMWFDTSYGYKPKEFTEIENIIKLWNAYISFGDSELLPTDSIVFDRFKKFAPQSNISIIPPNNILEKIITSPHKEDLDNWENKVLNEYYKEYKDYIEIIEERNVKVYILNGWSQTTVNFFDNCKDIELKKFYNNRFINLYSKEFDKMYYNLKEMMDVPKYTLEQKYPWSKNQHPSKEGHDLIAQSIINKLEKNIL